MKLTVDKMFLILGIISFPNLFFRGQYNVPLLIFCFACWEDSFKTFIIYALIISWFFDFYLFFDYIAKSQEEKYYESGEKGEVVLVVSIVVFCCKLILILYLIFCDEICQQSLKPWNISKKIKGLCDFDRIKVKQKNQEEQSR